jgi:hypothetical protein
MGYGAITAPAAPPSLAAQATGTAIHLIVSDPVLANALSIPASAIANIIYTTLTSSSGSTLTTLATEIVANVAPDLVSDVTSVVSDVSEAVPFLGTLIHSGISIIELGIQGSEQYQQLLETNCQNWMQTAKVIPVDSTAPTPADIFAPIYNQGPGVIAAVTPNMDSFGRYKVLAGDSYTMPALGYALTMLTENESTIPSDIAQYESAGGVGINWVIRSAVTDWFHKNGAPNVGLSDLKLAQFKWLRRAISSQLGLVGSMEGTELWPIYLDMLRVEFDAGHLNRYYCAQLLMNGAVPGVPVGGNGYNQMCNMLPLVDAIIAMVNQWRAQVNPVTASDIAALKSIKTSAATAMTSSLRSLGIGKGFLPTPTPAAPKVAPKPILLVQRTSTAEALGIGAVLASAAVVTLLILKKRRRAA